MNQSNVFDVLLLIARPGAGKSEIIHYLENTPPDEREKRFHVGKLQEIDDFPMLWTWFEEDAILESMGFPRLHSDEQGYFLGNHLWDLLIERIGLEFKKMQRDVAEISAPATTLVEFSRGTEHGGFRRAFEHLDPDMVERMAVLYINVSWEESLRKNRKRFNPDRPDSILQHSLPDEKLERLYRGSDWAEISAADPQYLTIRGVRVPYAVFENNDDVTTAGGAPLGGRLEETLNRLWQISQK